jgi:hypothetical protein
VILRPGLREELLRRAEMDQAARRAAAGGGEQAFQKVMAVDDDNARWLEKVTDRMGWPNRSTVGEDGGHAAWLLAQHADRHPRLQLRCLILLRKAVAAGQASAPDLAHLTDRVCLANGKPQIYGTQLMARDGRFVPRRLRDPQTVDQRRAAVGLDSLQTSLETALERLGVPPPVSVACPRCGAEIRISMPEPFARMPIDCPVCDWTGSVRLATCIPASFAR